MIAGTFDQANILEPERCVAHIGRASGGSLSLLEVMGVFIQGVCGFVARSRIH